MGKLKDMVAHDPLSLDITVTDGMVSISRNYEEALLVSNKENKSLIALLDAIINPGKYNIHIHDMRTKDVFSIMSFGFERDSDDVEILFNRSAV